MRYGIRKPSFSRSISAMTTGRLKREIKKSIIPSYGEKGMGLFTNPKKKLYNEVYSKTSISLWELIKSFFE